MVTKILFFVLSIFAISCSTTSSFKIPPGTKLEIYEREVPAAELSQWTTKPFFWTAAPGVQYKLWKGDELVDEGRISSTFRVASIFWPPFAAIYWPFGMRFSEYDFVNPDPMKGVRSRNQRNSNSQASAD